MREPVSDAAIRDPRMAALHAAQANGAHFPELAAIRDGRGQVASPFQLYYRAYQATDGFVILGALTPQNRAAIRAVFAIEDREHSDDPDFDARDPANIEATNHWRDWLEAEFRRQSVDHWLTTFEAVGVPAARLNFPEEMADDDQANGDGMIVDLKHTVTGPQRVVGPPVLLSRTPTGSPLPAPALGEHTREVLGEGGLTSAEIDTLIADGVVRSLVD
jgi:formyl-CoA transferase